MGSPDSSDSWTDPPTEDLRHRRQYLEMAASLLEQMFAELQILAIDNPAFALVLSVREAEVRVRLCTLGDALGLLAVAESNSTVRQLDRRAIDSIAWLSDRIDELTIFALSECLPLGKSPSDIH
jgi:hypothetical protein